MSNPYEVLGVKTSATDQEIKEAYRKLAVKYSTEDYATSDLKDVAAQKLAEIDSAYDTIMSQRRLGAGEQQTAQSAAYRYADDNAATSSYADTGVDSYADIRQCLERGDTVTAEQRLLAIDPTKRGAEWQYLMGTVCQGKGWLNEASEYFAKANRMDPNNIEYAAAYDRMQRERQTGGTYRPYARRTSDMGSECCDLLSCACCLSMCNCCGR